jgi:epoxyqueuosine reductase
MNAHDRFLTRELTAFLAGKGAALAGFADLSPVDAETRQGFPFAISCCIALTPRIIAAITDGPTGEYRAEYDRVNVLLTQLSNDTAAFLRERGWQAHARPGTGDFTSATLRAPFSHKMAATLAGLGWIGKCDLLITRELGSAARWVTVLTNAPVTAGTPVIESQCGACHACVDVCPGKACSGKPWRQGMPREEFWDPHACIKGMALINERQQTNHVICGMCIAACPHTKAYLKRML